MFISLAKNRSNIEEANILAIIEGASQLCI